jgi:hypothetical protein
MDELIQVALPAVEPVAEIVTDAAPALDPQQVADAANFAGIIAGDPEATNRYLESLLRLLDVIQDPSVIEVVRTCCN